MYIYSGEVKKSYKQNKIYLYNKNIDELELLLFLHNKLDKKIAFTFKKYVDKLVLKFANDVFLEDLFITACYLIKHYLCESRVETVHLNKYYKLGLNDKTNQLGKIMSIGIDDVMLDDAIAKTITYMHDDCVFLILNKNDEIHNSLDILPAIRIIINTIDNKKIILLKSSDKDFIRLLQLIIHKCNIKFFLYKRANHLYKYNAIESEKEYLISNVLTFLKKYCLKNVKNIDFSYIHYKITSGGGYLYIGAKLKALDNLRRELYKDN